MKRTSLKWSSLLLLFVGMSSCADFLQSIEETKTGKVAVETPKEADEIAPKPMVEEVGVEPKKKMQFAAHPEDLIAVEAALRALPQFKDKDIQVYQSIHFYDNYRVLLRIQNPDNLTYVDEYYYVDGAWKNPTPVVLSKHDKIERDIVSLDEIPFAHAHNVYKALKEKVEEIGGDTSDLMVYVITRNNRVRWYPRTISNERSRYSIEFKKDGTLLSFEQE